MEIPNFNSSKEKFDFLVANREALIADKKAELKRGDAVPFIGVSGRKVAAKSEGEEDVVIATVVINTTNLMDSHSDVHIPGLWNKSLKENKLLLFLDNHVREWDRIIADGDDLKAYTKTFEWRSLGYNFDGTTEALVFEATIRAERNSKMLNQYRKGHVRNHSVGMQYVKIVLAINSEDYGAEFEAWEKYFPMVANKDQAEKQGYFWAVTEAKVIEGSAVLLGSNYATPVLDTKKPPEGTSETKPPEGTSKTENIEIINNFKFI
jgi:hypothetical protein